MFSVIVQVRVVFRKTVVGDWHFDYCILRDECTKQITDAPEFKPFTMK